MRVDSVALFIAVSVLFVFFFLRGLGYRKKWLATNNGGIYEEMRISLVHAAIAATIVIFTFANEYRDIITFFSKN